MALKIFEKFDPRANPIDGNYPTGSIKNESVPGANDGTPLDADWGNDYVGYTDALLSDAEIIPSGDPDNVNASDRLDALKIVANKSNAPVTLSNVLGDTKLKLNMYREVSDRGNGKFLVITAGTTPNVDLPNGWDIIQCTGVPTLALKLTYQASGVLMAKHWGLVSDGVTGGQDVVLQYIINRFGSLLNDSGVTIDLGMGSAMLSAELLIQHPNIKFIGTGKRNVYLAESAVSAPCRASANSPTTLFAVHNDRNLIRFYRPLGGINTNEAGTFTANGVNFATLETGLVPTACFGFDASGSFHRDYEIFQGGVFGFSAVADMYDDSGTGVKQFAAFKMIGCNVNRNGYIAINSDNTQWNGFVFQRNEAGQNGVGTGGVMDIRGQNIVINDGNLLEGQANAFKINGNFRALIFEGNYFEANSADYVVNIEETIGSRIGPNYYNSITATNRVRLFSCVSPTVDENTNVLYVGCTNVNDMTGSIGVPLDTAAANGGSILMPFSKIAKHEKRSGGKTPEFFSVVSPEQQFNNIEDSAGAIHDTAVDGDFTTRNAAGTSYLSGDILCAVSIVSYDDLPVIAPRLLLNINAAGVDGTSSGIFNNFDKGRVVFKDRTFVMFSFAKAINNGTSTVAASVYPFGFGAASGLKATFTTWIWNLGQGFESLEPFVCPEMYERASAAPLVGTWNAGDTLKLTKGLGVAGGATGFFCEVAGTPGTWKTEGAIGA